MKSTKFWLALVGGLLALSLIGSVLVLKGPSGQKTAQILQDGVCLRTIDLSQVDEPCSFTVEWDGGYNVIQVERGRIRVSEADCPDRVCVHQGWISNSVVPIACLPHKLVIRLVGGSEPGIDGVTG